MSKVYIAVKIHAPTDTLGKRISCAAIGHKRQYFPWDYSFSVRENLRSAAEAYCQGLLNKHGWNIQTVAGLTEYESTKTGLPVGYVWE